MKTGKILSKKKVFKGKVFDVLDIDVEINSRKIKRQMLEESNGVVVIPVDEKGNVYLEWEYFIGPNRMMLGLVGGKTFGYKDSDLEKEAQRELQEEIGLKAKKLIKLNKSYVTPWTSNRVAAVYLALGLSQSKLPTGDHDEIIEVVKMSINDAIAKGMRDFTMAGHEVGYLILAREKLKQIQKSKIKE